MTKRPIVLIDMDGVLADFDAATETHLREQHPHIPIIKRRQNFYFQADYTENDHKDVIRALHTSEHFFRNLPVVSGALQGWQRIKELGYEPRICSSPLRTNQWCRDEKLAWVKQWLGDEAANTAIIDSSKENHDGIALIDDRPVIKNAELASWKHIVFDRSYNQSSDAPLKLYGWDDPQLAKLLEECAHSND